MRLFLNTHIFIFYFKDFTLKEAIKEDWNLVIQPKRKLLDIPVREVIRYRDLIALFIKRDFVTQYKQTILGPLWFIIGPLISTVMYTFVFGNLAKLSTDGIPHVLFYYSGTMLWTFFPDVLPMQPIFLLKTKIYSVKCISRVSPCRLAM